jgi:putative inorganic carbon (hco3(-)) transporter
MVSLAAVRGRRWHMPYLAPAALRGIALVGAVLVVAVALSWLPLQAAAAFVLGVPLVLLILLHPLLGLLLLVPVIPFSPLVSVHVGGVSVGIMEALLGLTLAAWLLRMATRRQIVIPRAPLVLPWLLWLAAMLLSWTQALSITSALSETVKWVEMLAIYLFVAANLQRRHLPWLLLALVAAGAAQAALGLFQFTTRTGPEGFLIFDGRYLRAYGTFQQPNPYAGYLGLTLPLAFSVALWGVETLRDRTRAAARPWLFLVPAAASVLILGAAYASQSRGAWIGIAAALTAATVVRSRRAAAWFGALAVAAALAGALGAAQLVPARVVQRFADVLPISQVPDIATAEVTDANFPAIERLAHWQAATTMWRDHPWLGVGMGNYPAVYPAYAIGRWHDPLGHAHNYYLNVGAETGLFGLLAYALFWLAAFWLAVRAVRAAHGLARAAAVGGLGVMVALSLHNGVDNLFVQGMYLHVAVILGMLATLLSQPTSEVLPTPGVRLTTVVRPPNQFN